MELVNLGFSQIEVTIWRFVFPKGNSAYKLLKEADLASCRVSWPKPNEQLVCLAPVNELHDLLTTFVSV